MRDVCCVRAGDASSRAPETHSSRRDTLCGSGPVYFTLTARLQFSQGPQDAGRVCAGKNDTRL